MNLALFDLDNTLLDGDSDFEWGQFLIRIGVLDREIFEEKNLAFFEQYQAGTLNIHEFLDFQLKPLARHSRSVLDNWHQQFMQESVLPIISPAARELVQQHLGAGDLCAIITATNSFVTAPIAREFGIPHLIATEPEQIDQSFTGKVSDIPCFREGKILRLEKWLSGLGLSLDNFSSSTFYSDSHNDLPLMNKVQHPVAVNPDKKLRTHAQLNGWPIINLRLHTPFGEN